MLALQHRNDGDTTVQNVRSDGDRDRERTPRGPPRGRGTGARGASASGRGRGLGAVGVPPPHPGPGQSWAEIPLRGHRYVLLDTFFEEVFRNMTPDQVKNFILEILQMAARPGHWTNNFVGTEVIYGEEGASTAMFYLDPVNSHPQRRVFALEGEESILGG